MKNKIQDGDVLELTAPATVLSGAGVLVNGLFGVAAVDAVLGARLSVHVEGVFQINKEATTAAFVEGEKVFWDDTAKQLDESAVGRFHVGTAIEVAGATATTVKVKLLGYSVVAV